MTGRLANKVALITGAAGALGTAIAEGFATEGIRGLVLADLQVDALDALRQKLEGMDVEVIVARLDVTDGNAFEALALQAAEQLTRLDVVVNNAGVVSPNARIHNLSTEDWNACLAVNLTGTFHGVRAATHVMRGRGGGSVINTASVSGITAWPYAAAYCAAKAGVVHLTRVAALEYAPDRIRVNCVCPGAFPSAIHRDLPAGAMASIDSGHPLGLGRPADVVSSFVHLASDDSSWVTGQALVVDGGYSLP